MSPPSSFSSSAHVGGPSSLLSPKKKLKGPRTKLRFYWLFVQRFICSFGHRTVLTNQQIAEPICLACVPVCRCRLVCGAKYMDRVRCFAVDHLRSHTCLHLCRVSLNALCYFLTTFLSPLLGSALYLSDAQRPVRVPAPAPFPSFGSL